MHPARSGKRPTHALRSAVMPIFLNGNRLRLPMMALLIAIVALGTARLAPAFATHATCPAGTLPVHHTPPADPALRIWDVEGKITAFSRDDRSITANGMTFYLPAGLLVKTVSLDQGVGNVEFAEDNDPALVDLLDATLEAVRSIQGGTVIASGETIYTTVDDGTCMRLVASSVFVELAENGIIGPLIAVSTVDGSFVVNGALIKMNTDPRFPSDLIDLGGNPIAVDDLVGNEGALMDIGGYYDAGAGILYGTVVQAEVLMKQEGKDTVLIERAQWQSGPGQLRVRGVVSRHPDTGALAATVDIFVGSIDSNGTGCSGTLLGPTAVNPADGTFDFRRNNVRPAPATVCVASPNGGLDDATVLVK